VKGFKIFCFGKTLKNKVSQEKVCHTYYLTSAICFNFSGSPNQFVSAGAKNGGRIARDLPQVFNRWFLSDCISTFFHLHRSVPCYFTSDNTGIRILNDVVSLFFVVCNFYKNLHSVYDSKATLLSLIYDHFAKTFFSSILVLKTDHLFILPLIIIGHRGHGCGNDHHRPHPHSKFYCLTLGQHFHCVHRNRSAGVSSSKITVIQTRTYFIISVREFQ